MKLTSCIPEVNFFLGKNIQLADVWPDAVNTVDLKKDDQTKTGKYY